jgi:hypothetical protein
MALAMLILLPVHLPLAAVCFFTGWLISPATAVLQGSIGHLILQRPRVGVLVESLESLPLMAWLGLHNTIVAGWIAISALTAYPAYLFIYHLVRRPMTVWYEWQLRLKQTSLQSGSVSKQPKTEIELALARAASFPEIVEPTVAPRPLAGSNPFVSKGSIVREDAASGPAIGMHRASKPDNQPRITIAHETTAGELQTAAPLRSQDNSDIGQTIAAAIDSIHALEALMDKQPSESTSGIAADSDTVLKRASRAAELVDEILRALDAQRQAESSSVAAPHLRVAAEPSTIDAAQFGTPVGPNDDLRSQVLHQAFRSHDTKVSIYRRARSGQVHDTVLHQSSPVQEIVPMRSSSELEVSHQATATHGSLVTSQVSRAGSTSHPSGIGQDSMPHEEALRNLLNHLRALQEKV